MISNLHERPLTSAVMGFALTTVLLLANPAAAQSNHDPKPEAKNEVGAGIALVPEYDGAREYRLRPVVIGTVAFDKRYVAFDGSALRFNVLNSERIEFGPVANWTFKRDPESIDNAAVKALGAIDDSFEAGAFAAVKFGGILAANDQIRLSARAMRDISGTHDGWIGDVAVRWSLPVTKRLDVALEASASFADSRYAETRFGVTAEGAAASGLAAFTPEGGIKDAGVTASARYAVTDRWAVFGQVGYRRLLGEFADSPLVADVGRADQGIAALGVAIAF